MDFQLELVARQDDRRRRQRGELNDAAYQALQLRRHVAADDDRDVLVGIEPGFLQEPQRGQVLRAAQGRRAEEFCP